MSTCVYCIAKTDEHVVRMVSRLRTVGFDPGRVSVLGPDSRNLHDMGIENSTKAPEGAAVGAGAGAVVGGTLGWLAGVGLLAIPGVGPLIAAGPILATLSGLAVGSSIGGVTGALVGLGIPEYEAQQYEGQLRRGKYLVSVHTENSEESSQAREIFEQVGGEDISTGTEAQVAQAAR